MCGTKGDYLAPEMLRHEPYSPAMVDIWTVGVLAYEVLMGRTPFSFASASAPAASSPAEAQEESEEGEEEDAGPYGRPLRFSDDISQQARDFIRRVLVADQHARPALADALAHPWLAPSSVRAPTTLPEPVVPLATAATALASAGMPLSPMPVAVVAQRPAIPPPEEQQPQQLQPPPSAPSEQKRAWSITDFDIGRPIGRGRYGSVFMARCKRSGRVLALKVLFKEQLECDGVMHQVRNEVEIHCRIKHPHIVACHGYFHDAHRLFLVMEYAPAELYKTLQKAPGGRFDEPTAAKYARQLISALLYLHRRHYIHRDLKPEVRGGTGWDGAGRDGAGKGPA